MKRNLILTSYFLLLMSCAHLSNSYLIPHYAPIGKTGYKTKSEKSDLEASIMAQTLNRYFTREELKKGDKREKAKGDYLIDKIEYDKLMDQLSPENN